MMLVLKFVISYFYVREFEEGKNSESSTKKESEAVEETKVEAAVPATVSVSTSAKASLTTPIARFAMNKPTSAPPVFEFSMGHPSGLSAVDVDIIKLTAQYTAANGRDFLGGIALREQRNPQFDFLKPTHMLFSYFTSLVDAYAKVLQPSNEQLANIKAKKNRMKALENAVHRWDWNRSEEERKKKETVQADEERTAFQSIDWFDFTVVETIDFADDELYELPTMAARSGGAGLMPIEEDADMDMDMDMDMEDEDNGTSQHMVMPPPPMGSSSSAQSSSIRATKANIEVEEEYNPDMEMEADSDLNIVTDYTPRIASSSAGPMTMVDPISGKVIPVDEMSEHMRVQLMDPRWRIEQKRFQDKQRETGYAEGGSIADSLKTFAKMRGDIFGRKENESQEEKKETVQWDGHMASIPQMQQVLHLSY
jgi:splicing factor 3A subunit 1